jgi:hypothetical protein
MNESEIRHAHRSSPVVNSLACEPGGVANPNKTTAFVHEIPYQAHAQIARLGVYVHISAWNAQQIAEIKFAGIYTGCI